MLESTAREIIEEALHMEQNMSNNEAGYKALIFRLGVGAKVSSPKLESLFGF